MTTLERLMAWEASLTDEQRWQVESGGMPLRMPEDWEPETTNEEESDAD